MQKCLQSVVREFQWRVGENHASEDTWSFVGYLNDEDLEKYADSKVLLEPVEFTGGKLAVLLRTQELNEGDVGVHMSTHFQAMGTDRQVFRPAGNHLRKLPPVIRKKRTRRFLKSGQIAGQGGHEPICCFLGGAYPIPIPARSPSLVH